MFQRSRPKQTIVHEMFVLAVGFSGVVHIGDVWQGVSPFDYSEAYAGYRGAASYATEGTFKEIVNNRLHYADQIDEDVRDDNILGEKLEVFLPNTRGVSSR
ncbi:hypothetical protein CIG75_16460 [Tumebacillus algifaecis]|uniref:Uncharacterized protein n=1 Tax=Tumebacillus algifaecis TaxID=1214604 RepID=A0A223D454_9BACL|nr:hypothetical protein [Tumebacillus algifaecis]ASS76389.1 hypothetical protein CIG75_16460 [Tumebacillus algifaecis]